MGQTWAHLWRSALQVRAQQIVFFMISLKTARRRLAFCAQLCHTFIYKDTYYLVFFGMAKWSTNPITKPISAGTTQPMPSVKKGRNSLAGARMTSL